MMNMHISLFLLTTVGRHEYWSLEKIPQSSWNLNTRPSYYSDILPLSPLEPCQMSRSYITALLRGLSQIPTDSHSLRAGTELAHWLNFATFTRPRHDTLWCSPSHTVLVTIAKAGGENSEPLNLHYQPWLCKNGTPQIHPPIVRKLIENENTHRTMNVHIKWKRLIKIST